MNKVTYASEYVDGLIEDSERQIKLRDEQISVLQSRNAACEDIICRLVGQYSASGLHAIQNSLNPAQSLLYDALQLMKDSSTALSVAITDIIAERRRQQSVKDFSAQQDDTYVLGELAAAAISYIEPMAAAEFWPSDWHDNSFKPSDYRRNLVKAGALIAAEIERLDRASTGEVKL
ncbi:hypothetical protein ACP3TG_06890 [Phytobacter diazotrophicus]